MLNPSLLSDGLSPFASRLHVLHLVLLKYLLVVQEHLPLLIVTESPLQLSVPDEYEGEDGDAGPFDGLATEPQRHHEVSLSEEGLGDKESKAEG